MSLSFIWNFVNDCVIVNESILILDGKVIELVMKKFYFFLVVKVWMII